MCYVEVRGDSMDSPKKQAEYLEAAIRELKRLVKKEDILTDLRKHDAYLKPSVKKRVKRNEAFKRRKREERKQEWLSKKPQNSNEME